MEVLVRSASKSMLQEDPAPRAEAFSKLEPEIGPVD